MTGNVLNSRSASQQRRMSIAECFDHEPFLVLITGFAVFFRLL